MRFGGGEFEDGSTVQRARIEFLEAATAEVPDVYHELLLLRPLLAYRPEDSPVDIVEFLQHPAATKLMVAPTTQPEEGLFERGIPVMGRDGKEHRAAWAITRLDHNLWRSSWDEFLASLSAWQERWRLMDYWAQESALYTLLDDTATFDNVRWRLAAYAPRVLYPAFRLFAYDLQRETVEEAIARFRSRLQQEATEYRTAGFDRPVTKANQEHFAWVARYQLLGQRPVAIARDAYRNPSLKHGDSEVRTVAQGIKRTAALIGLTLRQTSSGRPRKTL